MFDINDPDMREIVVDFCDECDDLLGKLEEALDEYEDSEDAKHLEEFGQIVDRMMGAAQTLGVDNIGKLCQMGKIIGYKSSQCQDKSLEDVSCGVLFDLIDLLKALVAEIRDSNVKNNYNVDSFLGRLKWLSDKLKHIDRASCSFDEEDNISEDELDQLIADFGDDD